VTLTAEDQPGLHDPALYDHGYPHDLMRQLRDHDPVSRHEHPFYEGGFWAVTRHADVRAISRDSVTWSNAPSPMIESRPGRPAIPDTSMLLDLDGEDHTLMRRIVSAAFTPRSVGALIDRFTGRMNAIIESLRGRTSADLVGDLAMWLPMHVIGDMLGIPESDRMMVFEWSERLAGYDPAVTRKDSARAIEELIEYAGHLGAARLADPQDDLLSLLVKAEVRGERLDRIQLGFFFLLLSSGGADTTRNLVVSGTVALLEHRRELERLRRDPALTEPAVEELLRYTSPLIYFCRQARTDTEVAGVPIAAGERVMLCYPSANRDERAFEKPDGLDITRTPNDHLAFGGGGAHFCIGANLARVEARVIFDAIVNRFEGLELAVDPATAPRLHHNIIQGFRELPVTWSAIR
jgi:cytochrome P450